VRDQQVLDRDLTLGDLAAGLAQHPRQQLTPLLALGSGELTTEDKLVGQVGAGWRGRFGRLV
jgi:hypothetical protein